MRICVDVHNAHQHFVLLLCKIVFCIACFFIPASGVYAATLFINPPSGEYSVGSTFAALVYVSSKSEAMNAASGEIIFPKDKLEVISLSTSGSIFNFWVENPTFSNILGRIAFEGVVFDPGYTGVSGKILTVTFRVKQPGTAPVSFSSASVLANDGAATNILSGQTGAQYTLVQKKFSIPVETTTPVPEVTETIDELISRPSIYSPTHSDESKWYANNHAKFTWTIPEGVVEVQTLLNNSSQSIPSVTYEEPIQEKEVTELDDGVWWMHVRFSNGTTWGPIDHYKVMVDTTEPEKVIVAEKQRENDTVPNVEFTIEAFDVMSGIENIVIRIDEGEEETLPYEDGFTYTTPAQVPGIHRLYVRAVDRAGNIRNSELKFSILGLEPPVITTYSHEVILPNALHASGITKYPSASHFAVVKNAEGTEQVYEVQEVFETGEFTWTLDAEPGTYTVSIYAVLDNGAQSYRSDSVRIEVQGGFHFLVMEYIMPLALLLLFILAIVLLYLLMRTHGKVDVLMKKIDKEVEEVEQSLTKGRKMIEKDLDRCVSILKRQKEGNDLTPAERDLVSTIREDVRDFEAYLQKEISDIDDLLEEE